MRNFIIYFWICVLLLCSCQSYKLTQELSIDQIGIPAGTKVIIENLYIDNKEISNVDYREYMHWIGRVYGLNSNEFNAARPDTTLWSKLDNKYYSLNELYYRHPAYQEYPVLGVSNNQAKKFAKWRSERVFELLLVKYKVIENNPVLLIDSNFTIQKYFLGQYHDIKPNPYILYYPEYKLLDSTINTMFGFKLICTYNKWIN